MFRLPEKDYIFSSVMYMFNIQYHPWPESVPFTEDFVSSPGMEIRDLPMDIYIENNNVNIYVNFAEMNKYEQYSKR